MKNFTLTPWAAWATNISCAQVVLLTAMEHLREEEEVLEDQTAELAMKDPAGINQLDKEDAEKPAEAWVTTSTKLSNSSLLSMLRMIGKVFKNRNMHIDVKTSYLSEKKVMPLSVLFASTLYFGFAAKFYFE